MAYLANMFSYTFMVRALIVGLLVSLCAALLGVSLVLKRYSMIGDGLSHVGFGALAVASVLGASELGVAIPVVVVAADITAAPEQLRSHKGRCGNSPHIHRLSGAGRTGHIRNLGHEYRRYEFPLRKYTGNEPERCDA